MLAPPVPEKAVIDSTEMRLFCIGQEGYDEQTGKWVSGRQPGKNVTGWHQHQSQAGLAAQGRRYTPAIGSVVLVRRCVHGQGQGQLVLGEGMPGCHGHDERSGEPDTRANKTITIATASPRSQAKARDKQPGCEAVRRSSGSKAVSLAVCKTYTHRHTRNEYTGRTKEARNVRNNVLPTNQDTKHMESKRTCSNLHRAVFASKATKAAAWAWRCASTSASRMACRTLA